MTTQNTNNRYAVIVQEEYRPIGQFTNVTFHVVDTEDHEREIAVFPIVMRTDAYDLAADLNNGAPEPTDRAGRAQWRDYTRHQY